MYDVCGFDCGLMEFIHGMCHELLCGRFFGSDHVNPRDIWFPSIFSLSLENGDGQL